MKHETVPDVVQDLLDGRARIEQGWCQNALRTPDGKHCALGALYGYGPIGRWKWSVNLLIEALPDQWKGSMFPLPDFNNDPDTTEVDVLTLYDRAIEIGLSR